MKFSIRLLTLTFATLTLLAIFVNYSPSSYHQDAYVKYHASVQAMYHETNDRIKKKNTKFKGIANQKLTHWTVSTGKQSIYMMYIELYEFIQSYRIHI